MFIGGKGISGVIHVQNTGRRDHAFKIVDVKVRYERGRSRTDACAGQD